MARFKLSRAKEPDAARLAEAARGRRWEAAGKAFWVVVIVALVAGLLLYESYQHGPAGLFRAEYEGRIVDKHVTIRESKYGSWPARRLLIEGKDGARFLVGVGPEVYERAEVGMWIKVANAQVELTRPDSQGTFVVPADGPSSR